MVRIGEESDEVVRCINHEAEEEPENIDRKGKRGEKRE